MENYGKVWKNMMETVMETKLNYYGKLWRMENYRKWKTMKNGNRWKMENYGKWTTMNTNNFSYFCNKLAMSKRTNFDQ